MRKILISVILAVITALSMAIYAGWLTAFAVMSGLLIHEAGHLVVLIRHGMPIRGLYFIPFVGAVVVSNRLEDRWSDAKMSMAGPAFGGASALLLLLAWCALRAPALAAASFLFAAFNAFNMLPLSPLDGGQALASLLDDGTKSYAQSYRRMWVLHLVGLALISLILRLWLLPLLAYFAFKAVKEHLKELARREDRARVRAALSETFGVPPTQVANAFEAPLWRLAAGEEPDFPSKLMERHPQLSKLGHLLRIKSRMRRNTLSKLNAFLGAEAVTDPPEPPATTSGSIAAAVELIELETALMESQVRDAMARQDRDMCRSAREAYLEAVWDEARAACDEYRLSPAGRRVVTDPSEIDPRPFEDGSALRSYLSDESEPLPIPVALAHRARWLYFGLAAGLAALVAMTGVAADWSFKPFF